MDTCDGNSQIHLYYGLYYDCESIDSSGNHWHHCPEHQNISYTHSLSHSCCYNHCYCCHHNRAADDGGCGVSGEPDRSEC